MEFIFNGKAFGSMAQMLMANNFDVRCMRVNAPLREDEWTFMDTAVLRAYRERLVVVQDLLSRGLTVDLTSNGGLGITVFEYESMNDPGAAQIAMEPTTRGPNVAPDFTSGSLPLPITYMDYFISIRKLASSRRGNTPLDVTLAEIAGRRVAEKNEDMVVNGASSYTFGGATIYGLTDSPDVNTQSISDWSDITVTGATILDEVMTMKQTLITNRCYGPYVMYIPTNFETRMDEDYGSAYPKTIRARLMEIENLQSIKVVDTLADDHVIFMQPTSDVIRLVTALNTSNVTWQEMGGLQIMNKVMNILVPQIRTDSGARNGIVHASV